MSDRHPKLFVGPIVIEGGATYDEAAGELTILERGEKSRTIKVSPGDMFDTLVALSDPDPDKRP